MCERKTWTEEEDNILKKLKEQNIETKWNIISDIMRKTYGIEGRNGKQCRERYHNHLDKRISKKRWSNEEDEILLSLHNQHGNRWAKIAREIQGRTDNCVKNRFYSRFRRAIRNINSLIKLFWKKVFKKLRIQIITKIIQTSQDYRLNKQNGKKHLFQCCEDFKLRIMKFSQEKMGNLEQNNQVRQQLQKLLRDINLFNKVNKRRNKKKKKMTNAWLDCSENEIQHELIGRKNKKRTTDVQFSVDAPQVANSKWSHSNNDKQTEGNIHIKHEEEEKINEINGNHVQQQTTLKREVILFRSLDQQVTLKQQAHFQFLRAQFDKQMENIFDGKQQNNYIYQVHDPQNFLNLG